MKFLVAIAMVALIGCSFTSAAAIDKGDIKTPESMEGFEKNLKNLLREVSRQIKENANIDDMEEFKSFIQENNVVDDDDEQASIVTEAEENLAIEEDTSNEKVDSGIHCLWHGHSGQCCQGIRVFRVRMIVCLNLEIHPPSHIQISLSINHHQIWHQLIDAHHKYRICIRKHGLSLCFHLDRLYISSHYTRVCLGVSVHFHGIHVGKHIGCISKHYSSEEISTTTEKEIPFLPAGKREKGNRLLSVLQEKLNGDVFRFDH